MVTLNATDPQAHLCKFEQATSQGHSSSLVYWTQVSFTVLSTILRAIIPCLQQVQMLQQKRMDKFQVK